jgi:hypothetical protein
LSRALHFGQVHRFLLVIDLISGGNQFQTLRTPLDRRETATLRMQFDKPTPSKITVDNREILLDDDGYFWRSWHEFGGTEAKTTIEF